MQTKTQSLCQNYQPINLGFLNTQQQFDLYAVLFSITEQREQTSTLLTFFYEKQVNKRGNKTNQQIINNYCAKQKLRLCPR